jgi:hypothetical protein
VHDTHLCVENPAQHLSLRRCLGWTVWCFQHLLALGFTGVYTDVTGMMTRARARALHACRHVDRELLVGILGNQHAFNLIDSRAPASKV